MTCATDWVGVRSGPFEASAAVDVLEEGSHRVVMAATGSGLEAAIPGEKFDLVVADLPLLEPSALEDSGSLRRWLHTYRAIEGFVERHLSEDGRLVALVSDNALPWMLASSTLVLQRLVAWQKKYAPQHGADRMLDSLHVFVAVLTRDAAVPDAGPDLRFLPFEEGGKTEDATRRHAEIASAAGREVRPPARLKPEQLWMWLAQEIETEFDSVLDLTASGLGLRPHLPADTRLTDVVWTLDPDLPEILRLLDADLELLEQPRSTNGDCDCGELAGRDAAPVERSRPVFLEARSPAALFRTLSVVSETEPAATIADRFLAQSLDLVTVEDASVDVPRGALSADAAVLVRISGDVKSAESSVLRNAPFLAPVGHLILRDPPPLKTFVPWLVLVPWLTGDPGPRAPSKEYEWANQDGDPRGPWRDPGHKGARSGGEGLSFQLRVPPYRWRLIDGELPEGLWRVDPFSGVIWGTPSSEGEWTIQVEVTDSRGATATKRVTFTVTSDAGPLAAPALHWLRPEWSTDGALRIASRRFRLPPALEVSIELIAQGGEPFNHVVDPPGKTRGEGRSRYWDWGLPRFESAVAKGRAIWSGGSTKRSLKARPRIKVYESDAVAGSSLVSVHSVDEFGAVREAALIRGAILHKVAAHVAPASLDLYLNHDVHGVGNYVALPCPACEGLEPEFACSVEHAVQQAGLRVTGPLDVGQDAAGDDWLTCASPLLADDLLGTRRTVVLGSGLLSRRLAAALRDRVGPSTPVLASRYLPEADPVAGLARLPEFQWT